MTWDFALGAVFGLFAYSLGCFMYHWMKQLFEVE